MDNVRTLSGQKTRMKPNLRKGEPSFPWTAACLGCFLVLALSACVSISTATPTPSQALPEITALPSATPIPSVMSTPTNSLPSPSPTTLPADFWQSLPVIPTQVSQRTRAIYKSGLALGNNPRVFSRIGDCASAAPAFLVGFDRNYNLGNFAALQPAVDYFQGAFGRPSLAAKAGLNSAGLLSKLWTGEQCQKDEDLLDCQYRLDQPAFALIAIGTNEAYYVHQNPGSFERNMRMIIEDTISRGIVPVLGTKADDVEGDGSINATIARLALEYDIPLWNFWRSVQPLPLHGMVEPEHLNSVSYANFTDFTIPHALEYGMQMRNLTALQMLDFLRQQLAAQP
jgi:hypothetical protein